MKNNPDIGNRIQLSECQKSTPAARIPKWRSMFKNAFITKIDNTNITTIQDIQNCITTVRENKCQTITCQFATITKQAMHPQDGIPLLYHDQLNIISQHLRDMKLNEEEQREMHLLY